jgi:malate synthase
VWQWIKHGATLQPSGKPLTREGFEAALLSLLQHRKLQAKAQKSTDASVGHMHH